MAQPGLQLGKVIRAWKAHSTRLIRQAGQRGFAWQSRYWERVVRNDSELRRIRRYIALNPATWEKARPEAGERAIDRRERLGVYLHVAKR